VRVARITTNQTCNHNCGFCTYRRPQERPELVATRTVLRRIAEALKQGAEEIVLTGGEPALRRDLASLAQRAVRLGARSVTLETNATLIDEERARELARAGVVRARVHLPAWGGALDEVTRDEGAFVAALTGSSALAGAGIRLEASIPIVRSTSGRLEEVVAGIASQALPVEALVIGVVTESPDPGELLPLDRAAAAIETLAGAARNHRIRLRMDAGASIPPCSFPSPGRVASLYSLTRGGAERAGYRRVAGCEECLVVDRCPGFPVAMLDREPELRARPISEDRTRRRLSLIQNVESQIARELVTHEISRLPGGGTLPVHTVRINFQCNQACHFCFVSTHLPAAERGAIEAAIADAGRLGAALAISGGEPTLNAHLADYVKLAKASGVPKVELQTNATRLGDAELVRDLEAAGVDVAFVSLHGSRAEVSDEVTDAPGTFELTLRGIDTLAKSSIELRLNFVFCQANRNDFPDFVRLVAARWPRARVTVSFVASSTDLVPRSRALVPRYTEVMAAMTEGLRLAERLGLEVGGFESMCGLPLCLIPFGMERYLSLDELPAGVSAEEFVKPEACGDCRLAPRCHGLRRGYADLYGDGELQPVRAEVALNLR
jgi:MoaA/NifB/PqqE/SkfB family radical SAM enzyme